MDADGATDIRALDTLYTALVPVFSHISAPLRLESVHTAQYSVHTNDEAVIAIGSR